VQTVQRPASSGALDANATGSNATAADNERFFGFGFGWFMPWVVVAPPWGFWGPPRPGPCGPGPCPQPGPPKNRCGNGTAGDVGNLVPDGWGCTS
jgi:hypothetical protein